MQDYMNTSNKSILNSYDLQVYNEKYRVKKQLGYGSFGITYLVTDIEKNKLRVLKRIFKKNSRKSFDSNQAINEALLLSKLNHPFILKYYECFNQDEFFCIVTEHCEGGDLHQKITELINENKYLNEKEVLDYFVQLILGMDYLHSRLIIHRDLKPENLFIKNGKIKIGDFGISRPLDFTNDFASTFVGSPYYMSPELFTKKSYNTKSDMWAIGCLLYEMCTFSTLFEAKIFPQIINKILNLEIPDLPDIFSHQLDKIFKKLLVRDPKERLSCKEILEEPLIENHIIIMKSEQDLNDLKNFSTIEIKNSRHEIANLLLPNSKKSNEKKTDKKYEKREITRSVSIDQVSLENLGNDNFTYVTPLKPMLKEDLEPVIWKTKKQPIGKINSKSLDYDRNQEPKVMKRNYLKGLTVHNLDDDQDEVITVSIPLSKLKLEKRKVTRSSKKNIFDSPFD